VFDLSARCAKPVSKKPASPRNITSLKFAMLNPTIAPLHTAVSLAEKPALSDMICTCLVTVFSQVSFLTVSLTK
jgi:hypothetical protein